MNIKRGLFHLSRLRLHNFWLFKDVDIDFSSLKKSGVIFVEGINHDATDAKSNWTGKTTLMINAFEWIIDGRYSRLQKVSDVVGAFDKWTMGSLVYKIGKSSVTITRYRNHPKYKNHLLVSWDGKDMSGERVIESREMFTKIVQMDVDRFAHGVLFGTDQQVLFERTPSMRNKLLAGVWGLEQFETAAIVCGKKCSHEDKRLAALHSKLKGKKDLLKEILDTIKMLEDGSANFNKEKKKRIKLLLEKKEEIITVIKKKTKLQNELIKYKEEKRRIQDGILELKRKMVRSSRVTDKIAAVKVRAAGTNEKRSSNLQIIKALKQDIADIQNNKAGVMCDECGNMVTPKSKRRLIKSKQERLNVLRKRNIDLHDTVKKYETQIKNLLLKLGAYNIKRIENSIGTMTDELIRVNENISELNMLLKGLDDMADRVKIIDNDVNDERTRENTYQQSLVARTKQKEGLVIEIDNIVAAIKKYEKIFYANIFWKKHFKVLRNLILTERVNALSYEFQYQLDSLTDGSISGRWEVIPDTGDIVCRLYDATSKQEKHYRGFSSAQRSKLNLAVDMAMAKLCAPNIGHMIIDEKADSNIDDVGFQKIMSHLASSSGLGKQVFLISHNRLAGQVSDAILRIERRGNMATASLIV
jgi:DNA repair exonuclease SbcCD ATPase subunit